jgi:hypothetical protein
MTLKKVMSELDKELDRKISGVNIPESYYVSSELFIEILEGIDYLHK